MRNRIICIALALALCVMSVPLMASAAIITLTDGNSSAKINPISQAGMYDWVIQGSDVLFQQWFWYRVGNTAEKSIDTLTFLGADLHSSSNIVTLSYSLPGQFKLDMTYTLYGGGINSNVADIAESIRITNLSSATLANFNFFQYSDFDLGDFTNNTVTMAPQLVVQTGPGGYLAEAVLTPAPYAFEANVYANTLNALNDGVATDLNNQITATGDATWAYQWKLDLAPGTSLVISKDKQAVVPVPPSAILLGSALFGMAGLGWTRRKKNG